MDEKGEVKFWDYTVSGVIHWLEEQDQNEVRIVIESKQSSFVLHPHQFKETQPHG